DHKTRPAAGGVLHRDGTAVGFGDGPDDGQAEPGAFVPAAPAAQEPAEDLLPVGGRHPGAVVAYPQPYEPVLDGGAHRDLPVVGGVAPGVGVAPPVRLRYTPPVGGVALHCVP